MAKISSNTEVKKQLVLLLFLFKKQTFSCAQCGVQESRWLGGYLSCQLQTQDQASIHEAGLSQFNLLVCYVNMKTVCNAEKLFCYCFFLKK